MLDFIPTKRRGEIFDDQSIVCRQRKRIPERKFFCAHCCSALIIPSFPIRSSPAGRWLGLPRLLGAYISASSVSSSARPRRSVLPSHAAFEIIFLVLLSVSVSSLCLIRVSCCVSAGSTALLFGTGSLRDGHVDFSPGDEHAVTLPHGALRIPITRENDEAVSRRKDKFGYRLFSRSVSRSVMLLKF